MFSRILHVHEDKGYDVRITVSEFKGVWYVNLRKYYLSYEGEYVPSTEGVSFPAEFQNVLRLVQASLEIISTEEAKHELAQTLRKLLDDLGKPQELSDIPF